MPLSQRMMAFSRLPRRPSPTLQPVPEHGQQLMLKERRPLRMPLRRKPILMSQESSILLMPRLRQRGKPPLHTSRPSVPSTSVPHWSSPLEPPKELLIKQRSILRLFILLPHKPSLTQLMPSPRNRTHSNGFTANWVLSQPSPLVPLVMHHAYLERRPTRMLKPLDQLRIGGMDLVPQVLSIQRNAWYQLSKTLLTYK